MFHVKQLQMILVHTGIVSRGTSPFQVDKYIAIDYLTLISSPNFFKKCCPIGGDLVWWKIEIMLILG
jgi:hypothetical protein